MPHGVGAFSKTSMKKKLSLDETNLTRATILKVLKTTKIFKNASNLEPYHP